MSQLTQADLLDPMTFPLNGARLIEASAGTGKTYTIAALYLRLLLGHGSSESAPLRPLTVDEILVVTFTEAATAELRGRIRKRIHEARIAFSRGHSDDFFLNQLLSEIDDFEAAAQIMLNAERQMDEAAVYTIHGFCQRMLTQHAFESGSRFSNEFVTDEAKLKIQAVTDYWRSQFYQLPLPLAKEVRTIWTSPRELLADIQSYLSGAEIELTVQPMHSLETLYQQQLDQIIQLKQQWLSDSDAYQAVIENSGINKRRFTKKSLPVWLESINSWAMQPTTDTTVPEKLSNFSQSFLEKDTKKDPVPSHPTFVHIDQFVASNQGLKGPLLAHAIQECRKRLAQSKLQQQVLSFDDLLTQLAFAIDSERGELLKQKIAAQYPVAMIDEFQDTDPLQYKIFSEIYVEAENSGLFMIGDPKQAIYGFRGADIFTYIYARKQVTSHFTLGTNWRSSKDMVQASNQLFESSSSPFIYNEDIPFTPVSASPKADSKQWCIDGFTQSAVNYWVQPTEDKPCTKESYYDVMASATADQIQLILEKSALDQAHFIDAGQSKSIQPSDIAVLVRTGNEAKRVKAALAKQGVSSVYLSNRDSVFSSVIAAEIKRLLVAVHNPEDRAIRASIASSLFGFTVSELDALNYDENLWDSLISDYHSYRLTWFKKGVQAMLWQVLRERNIANLLLNQENGERLLTDFNHLAELLQSASNELESPMALIRWLDDNMLALEQGLNGSEESIQRLESEQNLVQIITIHKSKGLEYDLVFLPFVSSYREASEAKFFDEAAQTTRLDLNRSDESLLLADNERLAEDLRLLYVALTRAVYGCFIGVSPLRNGKSAKEPTGVHKSAIGYLLQDGNEGSIADLNAAIDKQVNQASDNSSQWQELPTSASNIYQAANNEGLDLTALEFNQKVEKDWRITSYSGLVKQGGNHAWDASLEWPEFDIDSADELGELSLVEHSKNMFNFPRGANPGTFLHTLFETVSFNHQANLTSNSQQVLHLLQLENYDPEWLPTLMGLIDNTLNVELDSSGLKLTHINDDKKYVEMEFLLPIELLSAPQLHRLAQGSDTLTEQATSLDFKDAKGMLKGFIDLVFEHQGKFYVLDWKSNHLGDAAADYTKANISKAMIEHRYDVQYQLYTLALHRYLKNRIPNYDYDTHFGGVYYLFLRGIQKESNSGIFFTRPDKTFIENLDAHIAGELA